MTDVRLAVASSAGSIVGWLSQRAGRGHGETIRGRVIDALDPRAISKLAIGRDIVIVSGTNGKTTTTAHLAAILAQGTDEGVSTSNFGANMRSGIAAALAQRPRHRLVVLECDELYLPEMYQILKPKVIVLLNLSRDQLDRTGEVRKVANLWRESFIHDDVSFVIDRDDPFLEYAVAGAGHVVRVTFGGRKHPDAATCPACMQLLDWSTGDYRCGCGLGSHISQVRADRTLLGPARNTVLAIEAARLMGAIVPVEQAQAFTANAPDRVMHFQIRECVVATRLAKNPESWRAALAGISAPNVVLSVNARGVDGRDTSWLWDIDYRALVGKKVVCTGQRRLDVAYRLSVQGIDVTTADTFDAAVLAIGPAEEIEAIASFTAFQDLVAAQMGLSKARNGA